MLNCFQLAHPKNIVEENKRLNDLIKDFDRELNKYFNRIKLARNKIENSNDISEKLTKELLEILDLDR